MNMKICHKHIFYIISYFLAGAEDGSCLFSSSSAAAGTGVSGFGESSWTSAASPTGSSVVLSLVIKGNTDGYSTVWSGHSNKAKRREHLKNKKKT